jgi:metal-responsive CopG/Arc/MetJ family transcriptional regulator
MANKVIQVPIDDELLTALDETSRKQNKATSVLIREVCQCYLEQVESEELDSLYQHGYERLPEQSRLGEA